MQYISTRGDAPASSFEDVLLSGLASDGGLFMPESWVAAPAHSATKPYAEVAFDIMQGYVSDGFADGEFAALLTDAYASFETPEIAPVRQIGDDLYLLELFHGPTLAFKDFAMQVLSRLMERALKKRGAATTILAATSGDTGAAAVEAFRGRSDIEVFILYPHNRISDVQRRQMTTAVEDNVHILAVEGTFDDTQSIVKDLFNRTAFAERHALSAINSINWARIIAQAVYYFTATASIGRGPLSFAVPTGNFGDILAGYVALKMGLGMNRLVIATNENDILARALHSGRYQPQKVMPTDSPSMDIQLSSNFERLLFEASHRDAGLVRDCMARLKREGFFDIPTPLLTNLRDRFSAYRVTRDEAATETAALFDGAGILVDPHTAVGLAAAKRDRHHGPMVVLGTAHPAKFPDAVRRVTAQEAIRPARLERCMSGKERYRIVANSADAVAKTLEDILCEDSKLRRTH